MSQPVLLKVYGNAHPASALMLHKIMELQQQCLPSDTDIAELQGDLLLISFEGIYFPEDEVLAALDVENNPRLQGKLDVLDLENWVLQRHIFANGKIVSKSVPLNHVLDYSGH